MVDPGLSEVPRLATEPNGVSRCIGEGRRSSCGMDWKQRVQAGMTKTQVIGRKVAQNSMKLIRRAEICYSQHSTL